MLPTTMNTRKKGVPMSTRSKVRQQAVVYCRVSSVKQVTEGQGLQSQEKMCREFARIKSYEVVKSFHDKGQSGKLMNRPQMKTMLEYLHAHRDDNVVVIIDSIDRLARDLETHLNLRAAIRDAGATLESPSMEFGEDSDSKMIEQIMAVVVGNQREKNAERTARRQRARVMNGFWIAPAPVGYKYVKAKEGGKVLVRDEPLASIVQAALENFASGYFETQTEVKQFLEAQAAYPKDNKGCVHYQRVNDLLTRPLYAGRITMPKWNIYNQLAKHEALISYEAFQTIQSRLNVQAKAPSRKDLRDDFPMRGFITCCGCGKPLTSGWSKGRNKHYGYYHCHRKGCSHYGVSIKKEQLESDFEKLLMNLSPPRDVAVAALAMFRKLWDGLTSDQEQQKEVLVSELAQVEKDTEKLLDRLVKAESELAVSRYERSIKEMEESRIVLEEKIANCDTIVPDFDESFRTAYQLLENPHKYWTYNDISHKRTALRLVFTERIPYCPDEGFRTIPVALPIRVLEGLEDGQSDMVGPLGLEPRTKGL
ncbi:MAG: recombinase family protein [Candidatus Thiodiazotropha sp.]